MIFCLFIVIFGVILDQLIKWYAATTLSTVATVPIIPQVFHLTYVENNGAAFSLFSGQQTFLIIITFILILGLTFLLWILPKNTKFYSAYLALTLIICGAIGNIIDRMRLNYVVDYFDFRLIGFPIFNLADIFVCLGSAILILAMLKNQLPTSFGELKFYYKARIGKIRSNKNTK